MSVKGFWKHVEKNLLSGPKSHIKRKVLVIHAHPVAKSYSASLLEQATLGLQEGGHSVRVKRLYFNPQFPEESYNNRTFSPILTADEHKDYFSDKFSCKQVEEAAMDLQWCDAVLLVYPTVLL